jgi:1-deoxy-D-xylulose-5-phosphate synthase
VLALGNTVDVALDAYGLLSSGEFGPSDRLPTIVNARFAKPIDEALLVDLTREHSAIITLEEHSLAGGYGSAVVEKASDLGLAVAISRIGVSDVLVHHDSQAAQRALFGLTAQSVAQRIARAIETPAEIRH